MKKSPLFFLTFTIAVLFLIGYNQTSEAHGYFAYAQLNLPEYCDQEILDSAKNEFRNAGRDLDSAVARFFSQSAPVTQNEFEQNPEQYGDVLKELSNYLLANHVKLMERFSQTGSYVNNVCLEEVQSVYQLRPASKLGYEEVAGGGPYLMTREIDDIGGGCLIATVTFGSELAPQVQQLRELRDNTLLQTNSGTAFMTAFNAFYYTFSPEVADLERQNPMFKEAVKIAVTPLLASLALLQYVDIDSEAEMLGYGIGIIMLNVGMYFVAPAAVILKIKRIRA